MAKGFTVKAKNPSAIKGNKQQDKPQWDIDAIKARMKG